MGAQGPKNGQIPPKRPLDGLAISANSANPKFQRRPFYLKTMAKVCSITGARVTKGGKIHHRGLAKKKGGIGLQLVKTVKRDFSPNLRTKRIYVPELGRHVKVKLTARALKTVSKNGAYKTLKKAGLI